MKKRKATKNSKHFAEMQGAFFVQKKQKKGGVKLHNSNITLAISDQRKHFYQWDTGRKLIVTGLAEGSQIHFHREGMAQPFTLPVYADGSDLFCNVPDELLQKAKSFAAYTYITDKNGNLTRTRKTFTVEDRPKPADYIYTPTEQKTWDELYKRLDELELGARAIIDVEVLPTDDINPALLYRVPEGVFWFDGVWHKVVDEGELALINAEIAEVESIAKGAGQAVSYGNYSTMITALNSLQSDVYKVGQSIMIVTVEVPDLWVSAVGEEATEYTYTSDEDFVSAIKSNGSVKVGHYQLSQLETQKVDLTNYVKKGEYGNGKLLRTKGDHGMQNTEDGYIYPLPTQTGWIDSRQTYRWLNCNIIDYALKCAISGYKKVNNVESYDNQKDLGDKGRASAQKWLGFPYMGTEVEAEYSCESYEYTFPEPYSKIEGWISKLELSRVTTEVLSLDDLGGCVVDTEVYPFNTPNDKRNITKSLDTLDIRVLEGGYLLDLKVLVVNTSWKFNKAYGTSLPSNGTYLCYSERDAIAADGNMYTECGRVTALRKYPLTKYDNKYLDLDNNAVIKALLARIEALEAKA